MRALVHTWESPNRHIYGSVSKEEMTCLRKLACQEDVNKVVEFGTLFGHTALAFASCNTTVYTVDNLSWNPFGMSQDEHREFLRRNLSGSDVRFVELDVMKEVLHLHYPDLVFIDAKHNFPVTTRLLDWASERQAKYIVCHDTGGEFPGVDEAVNLFERTSRSLYECGPASGTLWVARRV